MRRSSPSRLGVKHLRVAGLLLVLLLPLAVAPDRSVADGPTDSAPIVTNPQISTSTLTYQGGQVTISADGIDDFGITMFYADVQGSNGSGESVQLIQSGETTFSGIFNAPPNYTDSPVSYYVTVQATDTNGATDSEIAGEIEVAAQPQFDEPPIVADPSVTPRELPAASGPVTIQATATDLRGISEAYATVALPGGGTATVALEPISFTRFEGVFTPPPNSGTAVQRYGIEITALDDIGQPASVDAGSVSVAPRPGRPAGHHSPCRAGRRKASAPAHVRARPRSSSWWRSGRAGR